MWDCVYVNLVCCMVVWWESREIYVVGVLVGCCVVFVWRGRV